jgi:hypothetical protein
VKTAYERFLELKQIKLEECGIDVPLDALNPCGCSQTQSKIMLTHNHKISRDKFLAEMERRGWKMDGNGWIVPEGRRQHDKEADWYQSILAAIECECPHAAASLATETVQT